MKMPKRRSSRPFWHEFSPVVAADQGSLVATAGMAQWKNNVASCMEDSSTT